MADKKREMDWNAKLVAFFYSNSRLVWLVTIVFIIGGLAGLKSLRQEGFPAIQVKTVFIQTIYPGASSQVVESKVTKEIESAVKEARGMKDYSSVSANNYSQIVVNFEPDSNLDQAITDLQSKVASITGNLPKDAQAPKVIPISTGGSQFIVAVSGGQDANLHDVTSNIADRLSETTGIKSSKTEDLDSNLNLTLNYANLAKYNISPAIVNQVISANNLAFPVGQIDTGVENMPITVQGSLKTEQEIKDLVVGAFNGKAIKLSDVASFESARSGRNDIPRVGYRLDGELVSRYAELINIETTSTADIQETKKNLDKKIEKLKNDGAIAGDIDVVFVYDQAAQTTKQVNEIVEGALGSERNFYLLGGVQLLILAMLLLVNWRAALVAALSLPLSFAFTFMSLWIMGVQLNTLVLFSLILVLGLVVDPAIIMVEAIQRYRDIGLSAKDSVIESGKRYGASLFMAVLTSLIVFIPFGVISGFFGEIIRFLPITIIPALVASYFVPIALLPYLTNKFFRGTKNKRSIDEADESKDLNKLSNIVMEINRWILTKKSRGWTYAIVCMVLVVLSTSLVATGKIPIVQFASPEDNEMISIQATYKPSIDYTQKDLAYKQVEEALLPEAGIEEYFTVQQTQNSFWLYVNLKPQAQREDADLKSKKIVERVKDKVKTIANLYDIDVTEVSVGPPGGSYQIQAQIEGSDLEKLKIAALDTGKFLRELGDVTKVNDGFTDQDTKEIAINVDRSKLALTGLDVLSVSTQLKGILDSSKISSFDQQGGEVINVNLSASSVVKTVDEIKKLTVISPLSPVPVRISDIAEIVEQPGVANIEHYNGKRFVSVKARVDSQNNTIAVQSKLDDYLTPERIKAWGADGVVNKGDAFDISKSFSELGIALLIAIILTYVVLVLQFKSFSLPLIMLFTIPLSFIGVFPALYLTHSQFGFLELLGITILVGIVENVAILLIDYANQLVREKGMSPRQAIILASGVRFRPILLTKLVALGGLLPLAIESPFWRGLSVVIIAGIGVSGFLSLVLIPILYDVIMKRRIKAYGENI